MKLISRHALPVLLAALMGTAATSVHAQYEGVDDLPQIHLRMAETNSQTSDAGKAAVAFVEFVEAQSKGKIEIEVFWSNALMLPTETPEGLGSGLADIAATVFAHFRPSDFPVSNWVQIVGVKAQGGNPFGSMVATGAATEYFATSKDIEAEFTSRNIKLLGGSGSNAYDILCTSPIATLADARGKRTRTGTTTLARQAEALTMVPVPLDSAEAYEAFSRGIIDCGNMEILTYVSLGMVSVPRDLYWTPVTLTGLFLPGMGMNLDKWNSLPPVAQQIIRDGLGVYLTTNIEQKMVIVNTFGDLIESGQVKAVQPSEDILNAARGFNDAVFADMVATAPPGVADPAAAVAQMTQLFEKWTRIVGDELGVAQAPDNVEDLPAYWQQDFDFDGFGRRIGAEVHSQQ